MQIKILRNRFLKDNIYLLLTSLLLLSISIFTQQTHTKESINDAYKKELQNYIYTAEKDYESFFADTSLVNNLLTGNQNEEQVKALTKQLQYFYVYSRVDTTAKLIFWSSQTVLPDSSAIFSVPEKSLVSLANGFYFAQKKSVGNIIFISLLPIKWNYNVSNDYLRNEFAFDASDGKNFDLSFNNTKAAINTKAGDFLFSLNTKSKITDIQDNKLTIWLRLLSFIPLFIFIHFAAIHICAKKGLIVSLLILFTTLFSVRLASYFFTIFLNLRQFQLFNPAVYGSDIVLRSLGDLLINALLFLWLIIFIKNNLREIDIQKVKVNVFKKWAILILCAFVILIVTFTGGAIIKSMVADSQISFDVLNVFSLDFFSVIGFLVLCCIAIGYYYFCRIIFFCLKNLFPRFMLPFFLMVAVGGLLLLTLRVGKLSGAFELYELIWLLLFLLLIKNELLGIFSSKLIVSKLVFWLFFFSVSITFVIITENNKKELSSRKHYAEVIATKSDPINDAILNSLLTEFRPELLASKFYLFNNAKTAFTLKDSLINNNFSSYTNNYETKILVYDNKENPLNNEDPISFNSINSILNTQAKPTPVTGMYFYDTGFDNYNYIARRIIKNENGSLLGYIFIIINSRKFTNEILYPELFSRGHYNSIENSTQYAFAIYKNGKIITSHNDYAFTTKYLSKYFLGNQFLLENKNKYNELWYNAGGNKFVVIVKENNFILQLITLFSYLFCSFILLNALSTIITILLKARFKLSKLKNAIQLTIRQQVHGTIIFFSIISFLIIGIATILFFINRAETNNKEILTRTIKIVQKDLTAALTKDMMQSPSFGNIEDIENTPLQKIITRMAQVQGQDINLYTLSGDLKASSISLPYEKGIVSKKIDPIAYHHLNEGKEIQYYQNEHIGKLDFVSNYIPVTDSAGVEIAYLNIPYFTSETRLKEEISNFFVTIINLNAFILLIAGIVALIITNRITNSFSIISEKMKQINLTKHNEAIVWNRNDEIGDLVKEYNKMVEKLDASATALARTERENAWQEMAKQVAHEIKNPLTPMKLSMQFLHRAIEDGAPNIKELSTKVSATLVEQIDHLSSIAEEFSRFANIENANPETFNINDALISIKQLYEGDENTRFVWKLIPNEVLVYADKTHVNRILTNLILNGIQSVNEGTIPRINIYETVHNNKVEIEIADNGNGINEQIKSKIFTPNFTTKSSGTGLGLAMCKRMAEQAGGDISFETSVRGTSFFVLLPIAQG